jgi:NitT/TauT family transport system substrate-binding protein
MQPILRRGVLLFLLVGTIATASIPASSATELLVGTSHQSADAELPAAVGVELGIFKKDGLDLTLTDFGGGSHMMQAMAAGSIGIGVGAGSEMALVAKGAPALAICEDASTLPYFSIGVPYGSSVHSLSELKGDKVGVTSNASLTSWLAHELARHEGWGPEAIEVVAIGGNPAAVTAALRAHLVDATVDSTMEFEGLEEHKVARVLAPVSSFIGRTAGGVIFASDDMMKEHPDTIRRYLAAFLETTLYMETHKDETVRIEGNTHYPQSIVAKAFDIDQGMFTKDCRFDAESLANLSRSFVDLKLVPTPPDMSKLYTAAYVP